jgi:hypothetical protein
MINIVTGINVISAVIALNTVNNGISRSTAVLAVKRIVGNKNINTIV